MKLRMGILSTGSEGSGAWTPSTPNVQKQRRSQAEGSGED